VRRNVRLAAIKSFFRFLEYRQPAALEQIRRVLAIPFKKTDTLLVPYLLRDELQAVLDAPDPATHDGIRDRAMLHVAVCAGLRVSELTGLKVDDIDLPSMSIRVLGKGRRERALPLWKPAAAALRAWLAIRGQVAIPEVFVNARGEPLSRKRCSPALVASSARQWVLGGAHNQGRSSSRRFCGQPFTRRVSTSLM
jgi:integrase/recombinase XerD